MTYVITGLDPELFCAFFGMNAEELAARNVVEMIAVEGKAPCRVSLDDAPAGSRMLLLNHTHLNVAGPYRSSHAIFVAEGSRIAAQYEDEVPPMMKRRTLSVRSFDANGMMVNAELVEGMRAGEVFQRLLEPPEVAFLHAHLAIRGCFAATVQRS